MIESHPGQRSGQGHSPSYLKRQLDVRLWDYEGKLSAMSDGSSAAVASRQPRSAGDGVCIRVLTDGRRLEVWLHSGRKRVLIGPPLDSSLVVDARRYGQDLLADVIDDARRVAERNKRKGPRA